MDGDARRQASHRTPAPGLHRRERATLLRPRGSLALASRPGEEVWVDGEWRPAHVAVLPADDSGILDGRACVTTARWDGETLRFSEAHGERLAHDALALGIGHLDPACVARALAEIGRHAFGDAPGIVRLQASRASDGSVRLVGTTRALGDEPPIWRVVCLPKGHASPLSFLGAKVASRLHYTLAMDRVRAAAVEEGLVFDDRDRLVEGVRSNLVLARNGVWTTPPLSRGAVAGVALRVVRARMPTIREADVSRCELGTLDELVAVNAVRGSVAIVQIDGRPVGSGRPGPLANTLAEVIAGE